MIKRYIVATMIMISAITGSALIFSPSAQAAANCPSGHILTLKPWYDGLLDNNCVVKSPGTTTEEHSKFIWTIVLNVIDDLFQIIGYIATGFIIYGGFLFMTTSGDPARAAQARKTLLYAVIGVVIAIASVGVINLVSGAVL